MKRILPETEFSEEQLNKIRSLADECNLCADTVKILYGRGFTDKQSIHGFMHPSRERFISPFKMRGMKEVVELITKARDDCWGVVVFGDYDADGICAATILGKALKDFGIEAEVVVPERRHGYGLSEGIINDVFEEYFPQLVITVDCGISCAEEVEYIKMMGSEVIVTDHHELPEKIPDCICINPKFDDDYIYDNLCGAGVAFKLACALIGIDAYKYLDFAAIATVADSVPLTGENRDIVYEGLKQINRLPAQCYASFLNKAEGKVTSHVLAFSIAPKINAAGRMGDADSALMLFNSTNEGEIFELSTKLVEYNLERQKYCDELYLSAKQMLKARGEIGNVIMLCNENWNAGFVGIVAARLADEYSRPAILFVKNGEMLKGSARSVENVNIFEALRACSEYIAEFGGHSQAAGVNVTEENFEPLYNAINRYIGEHYTSEDFVPTIYINGTLDKEYSERFAQELEMLEPYGVGNRRPLFEMDVTSAPVKPIKAGSQHVSVKNDFIEMMYFGGNRFATLLESSAPKKLIFEYNISSFRGKEYVKGFVRDVIYDRNAGKLASEEIALSAVNILSYPKANCQKQFIGKEEVENLMANCGAFGTVFIAYDYDTVTSFDNAKLLNIDLFVTSSKNGASVILLAPTADVDLSVYTNVVLLGGGVGERIPALNGKSVYIYKSGKIPEFFGELNCQREDLLKIFSNLSANVGNIEGATAEEVARRCELGYSKLQVLFALKVFEQLSLVSFSSGRLKIHRGVKTDLKSSELYYLVSKVQAG